MGNYFVIGGSSGIGKEIVSQLLADGHMVYATFNENETSMSGAEFSRLNVLEDDMQIPEVESLDGLVYCPGSINLKPFHRIKPEAFVDDFNLQVVGAIKAAQAVLPLLKKGTNPSIVLFSTVAVQSGFPFHSQVAASKGALEGLTRALAAEFAPTIRVNCIAPSITDTPLAERLLSSDEKREANAQRHPLKEIGNPDDIAHTATFLLSPKAKWITGQILHVDGGMSSIK